jgi:hypothetical protein
VRPTRLAASLRLYIPDFDYIDERWFSITVIADALRQHDLFV